MSPFFRAVIVVAVMLARGSAMAGVAPASQLNAVRVGGAADKNVAKILRRNAESYSDCPLQVSTLQNIFLRH
jgi:hypothetical protein